jgi:hypothetical protein
VIPGGLGSLVYRVRDMWLRWVADRNQIMVPSMIADRRVESTPPPDDVVVEAAEHAAAELDVVGSEK